MPKPLESASVPSTKLSAFSPCRPTYWGPSSAFSQANSKPRPLSSLSARSSSASVCVALVGLGSVCTASGGLSPPACRLDPAGASWASATATLPNSVNVTHETKAPYFMIVQVSLHRFPVQRTFEFLELERVKTPKFTGPFAAFWSRCLGCLNHPDCVGVPPRSDEFGNTLE